MMQCGTTSLFYSGPSTQRHAFHSINSQNGTLFIIKIIKACEMAGQNQNTNPVVNPPWPRQTMLLLWPKFLVHQNEIVTGSHPPQKPVQVWQSQAMIHPAVACDGDRQAASMQFVCADASGNAAAETVPTHLPRKAGRSAGEPR